MGVNLHTGSHEDAVGGCFGTNDVTGEADHLRSKIDRSTTEGGRDRCPSKVSHSIYTTVLDTHQKKLLNPRIRIVTPVN